MPPLELTGERTLPDVPEENYWFRRHLAVYEWIAARVGGLRVADLACGEGYGSDVLAATAAEVVGVDANPEAHEHARRRYRRPNLRFERDPGRELRPAPRRDRLPADDRAHRRSRRRCSSGFASLAPVAYVSTPNRLTLAPPGAEKSDNPWHLREYTLGRVPRAARALLRPGRDPRPLPRPQAARCTSSRCAPAGTASTRRCGITKPFYDRFVPAIAASDFALRPEGEADLDRALDFVAVCHA